MENQHRLITGYRELDQEEIDLMNEIKVKVAELKPLLDKVEAKTHSLKGEVDLTEAEPWRWLAIARTHFQEGAMALTRAVARPNFF